MSGTLLAELADLMDQYAVAGARLTPYQKIVLIGVDPGTVEPLVTALDEIGLPARPSNWRRNTMACTGIEFCKLAIVETKERARTWSPSWRSGSRTSTPRSRSTSTAAQTPARAPRPTSA